MDKVKLALELRAVKRILDKGERAGYLAQTKRKSLQNDTEHSQSYKDARFPQITRDESNEYRRLGAEAREHIDTLMGLVDSVRSDFDFRDTDFQSALSAVSLMGKGMPLEMQRQIVDTFKGRPVYLNALRVAYGNAGLNLDHIDELRSPFDAIAQAEVDNQSILEFLAFAQSERTEASWRSENIKPILSKYSRAFGIDMSISPYVAAVNEFIESTSNTSAKARAESFLRVHGADLANDDATAISLAESYLAEGFRGV